MKRQSAQGDTMSSVGGGAVKNELATLSVLGWVCVGLLPFTVLALCLAAIYTPEQVGQGLHLLDLGLPLAPCPGCALCGLSRGFSLVAHGRVVDAIQLNPLIVLVWPACLLVTAWASWHLARWRGRRRCQRSL